MNINWFSKVLEVLKHIIKYKVPILLITGTLLFLPDNWLDRYKLKTFVDSNLQYISLIFLSIGLITLWDLYNTLLKWIKTKYYRKKSNDRLLKYLKDFDDEEKSVLREFFIFGVRNTIQLPADNATVANLISKGILVRVGEFYNQTIYGILFSFKINEKIGGDIILNHIHYPERSNKITEDWLNSHRPSFIWNIDYYQSLINGSHNRF